MVDIRIINFVLDIFSIFVLGTVLIGCHFDNKNKYNRNSKCFVQIVLFTMIRAFADMISWVIEGRTEYSTLAVFITLLIILSGYVTGILFVHYLHFNLFGDRTKNILRWIDYGFVIFVVLAVICSFSGMYFYIEDGYYVRGSLYYLSYAYPILMMVGNLITLGVAKNISRRERICYLIYMITPTLGEVIQAALYGISSAILFNTVNINLIYINIYLEKSKDSERQKQIEQEKMKSMEAEVLKKDVINARLESELTHKQVAIMMSQIQPHFLYNALGTIQVLCTKDPELARKAMDHFSRYLRANMNSIDIKDSIPFSKELVHIEHYLFIEKLRFAERLNVFYDIQSKDFKCPPLCVQTMVENAVKHGICKKKNGGELYIRSYETEEDYCIEVEDTGIGFDTLKQPEDGQVHIGIANTRDRLKDYDGMLWIESEIGKGTKVTIKLSKEKIEIAK